MKRTRLSALRAVLVVSTLLTSPAIPSAQDLRLDIKPSLLVPLSDTAHFGFGGGASINLDLELLGLLYPYVGMDVAFLGLASEGVVTVGSASAGFGFFAHPWPRLRLSLAAGGGAYVGAYETGGEREMTGNLFWKAAFEAGYRLRPNFTVSAAASYMDLRRELDSFWTGLGLSVSANFALGPSGEGNAPAQAIESRPAFPTVAASYSSDSFGTIAVLNAESAEIRNVELWFQSEGYTSAPVLCATIPVLGQGKTAQASLLARFSEAVLSITEQTKIRGQVLVRYQLLGQDRESQSEITLSLQHRNAITWADRRILAAFASPNDPAVLDMSKFLAGVVRSHARGELDSNLQYGLGLFEGLHLGGISWTADPQTAYASASANPAAVDYVQYPHQSLAYRSGDSDDLAALYAALLESVGIPAALVPMDGEVLAAFRMAGDESSVRSAFSDAAEFFFIDGQAWVPIRISALREGFLIAWSEGAKLFRDGGGRESFYRLSDAWKTHPPIGVPDVVSAVKKPAESTVATVFENAVALVVSREVEPRAQRLRSSFGSGGGSGVQRNTLGVLYARYGMYPEAKAQFEAASSMGYEAAYVNLGNIAFLTRDWETAERWYRKAALTKPDSPSVIIGLARTLYELDRYEEADALFKRAILLMPALAERYGYLSASLGSSASRASAASDRGAGALWED